MKTSLGLLEKYAPGLLFCTAFLYSVCLSQQAVDLEIASTISFILISTFLYALCLAKNEPQGELSDLKVVLFALAVPVGVLLPTLLFGTSEKFFWVADSVAWHVPRSTDIAEIWRVKAPLKLNWELHSEGFLTHTWVGLFFAIFGAKPWVSVVALAILKVGTAVVLVRAGRTLFKSPYADKSFLVYLAAPTILFHTTAFYKEATVHFLVATTAWMALASLDKMTIKRAFAFALLFIGFAIERHYFVVLLAPIILTLFLTSLKSRRLATSAIFAAGMIAVFMFHPYAKYNVNMALEKLLALRQLHAAFPDVNFHYNYEIPYAVAIGKSLMTPIWTPSKIDIFRNFSALLTWGSFLHQLIMLSYIAGVVHAVRTRGKLHLFVQLPFVVFILFIAYVSPWAGRIRDSFGPIIAIYSCYYLKNHMMEDVRRIKGRFARKREPA